MIEITPAQAEKLLANQNLEESFENWKKKQSPKINEIPARDTSGEVYKRAAHLANLANQNSLVGGAKPENYIKEATEQVLKK